jgi:hypothetical protein
MVILRLPEGVTALWARPAIQRLTVGTVTGRRVMQD